MKTLSIDEIHALPEYRELLYRRRRVTRPLTILMLAAYFSFILAVGYTPDLLATKLSDGVTSVGILLGLFLILLTFAITAFYVWYANKHLEDLVIRIQAKGQTK